MIDEKQYARLQFYFGYLQAALQFCASQNKDGEYTVFDQADEYLEAARRIVEAYAPDDKR